MFITCSDTLADLVDLPFILILREFLGESLMWTVVVTPLVMEMPAPQEPFLKGSSDWSCIRKIPVMCPGENAVYPLMSTSHFCVTVQRFVGK